jgi:uncharacterized membrane protein
MTTASTGEVFDDYDSYSEPRWPWIAGTILSLLGLGVSIYLTIEHYTGSSSLSCPAGSSTGVINCLKVTTSPWSMWYGIPVAVLGLVYFVVMLALQSPWAWRRSHVAWRAVRIAWCVIGLASALRLVYYELYRIDAICEWCTSVHIITFLIFITTIFGTLSTAPIVESDQAATGLL